MPPPPVAATNDQPLAGLSVLAVDDEADARELIATVLEQAGARAITASTAEEALEALLLNRFDVLLSDIGIPGADGYSLIRRVRDLAPEQGGNIPAATRDRSGL
jgi:CheY-like chemotaxis protein